MPKRAAKPTVRVLKKPEYDAASRLVGASMLASLTDETTTGWSETFSVSGITHGAFAGPGEMAGVARWFPSELSLDGGALPVAAVTAVAVLTNHRRQGHLTRLMHEQLASIAKKKVPIALLVAAEWPIYGRFGYGPAIDACKLEVDSSAATFFARPTGSIELVEAAELRPHLEAVHDMRWARTMGAIKRDSWFWDRLAGVERFPGDSTDVGKLRGAIWRNSKGDVQGAVSYQVVDGWTDNRPSGKVQVRLLVGATAEAERELWRHLCAVDWTTTVVAGDRPLDDPLPLMITNGRAAVRKDLFDCIWARVLDVPAVISQRRAAVEGRVIVQIKDDLDYTAGTWAIEVGPDGASAEPTSKRADVRMPTSTLGTIVLGGRPLTQLHHAGHADERREGAIALLDSLLRAPTQPWSPTTY